MEPETSPKLSAPRPILLRLDDVLDERLWAAKKKTGLGRQDIIRNGLSSELARIEAQGPRIAPEIAKAIQRAELLGIDPLTAITQAIEDKLSVPTGT